jgi:hypothetical protein
MVGLNSLKAHRSLTLGWCLGRRLRAAGDGWVWLSSLCRGCGGTGMVARSSWTPLVADWNVRAVAL